MKTATTSAIVACISAMGITDCSVARATDRGDSFSHLPATLSVTAVIRDFRASGVRGGHPDFQSFSGTTTVGLVEDELDEDSKPVAASLRGWTIQREFKDSAGRNIMPSMADEDRGDRMGLLAPGGERNGLTSAQHFWQWYRDVPGVNVSKQIDLTLNRVEGTNRYVFDSATDAPWVGLKGFFPINGELFADSSRNWSGTQSNFHFTTEVSTEFVYNRGTGQVFRFTGDDDVWVFIDGKLVIDLGGVHARREQTIELDRLENLSDGNVYSLKVFHAERHTVESNFRIETTIQLRNVDPPITTNLHD
ncbi:MAG: fibro-slime domain-containing protein [Planctomycetota bacterium]|nr:fibro-slime domain-containing protein [Planctomycetota bacterium]